MIRSDKTGQNERQIEELRRQLIQDTERFLTDRLHRANGHRQDTRRSDNGRSYHPYKTTHDSRRGIRADADTAYRSYPIGTLVQVPADDCGHVAGELLELLASLLSPLRDRARRGDVLLDLTGVRSVTSRFTRLLENFRQDLASQDRDVYLYNTCHPYVAMMQVSKLSQLVRCVDVAE